MYASTRMYEGVSDPQEVARLARERFVPLVARSRGSPRRSNGAILGCASS